MGDNMLQLQQQVRNNSDELQDYLREMGSWVTQMEKKDEQLKKKKIESKFVNFETPRSVDELKRKNQSKVEVVTKSDDQTLEKKMKKTTPELVSPSVKEEKIQAFDYDSWSKFDVEKALDEIDKDEKLEDSELRDMDADMRLQRAIVEKDRGNECFKAGKYDEAIRCYTRGMQCDPKNAILPANRAMAYLKTEEWRRAEADCSLALSLDDTYVKAYQRRATARKNLKDYTKAIEDLRHVLLLEPNNKQAKSEIDEVSKLESKKETPTKVPKENAPPVTSGEKSKVKGMFNTKSSPTKGSAGTIPGQIFPIEKPPHLRSKTPLQQIEITEVQEIKITEAPFLSSSTEDDQMTLEKSKPPPSKPLIEVIDVINNSQPAEPQMEVENVVVKDNLKSKGLPGKVEKAIINDTSILQRQTEKKKKLKKPSSASQFDTTWSKVY